MEHTTEVALDMVLERMKREGTKSPFSKAVFLAVLGELPAAPNIPGLEVFRELGSKTVPYFVDLAIIRDGKVFLTYRDDAPYVGWHFPGFMRYPRTGMIENCQAGATRELGPTFKIIEMYHLYTFDQPADPRFHLASDLQLVKFEGEPVAREGKGGEWFSEMPVDILPTHMCYWPHIVHFLKA